MWDKIISYLGSYPERLNVAKVLIKYGLSVRNGKIYCGDIIIPVVRISKVANVDRRTVIQTIKMIESNPELKIIFSNISPAGSSLREVAKYLNFGVIEIAPTDARMPGILAAAASIIAQKNISIRQAIVDDPELTPEPKLTLITETKVPGEIILDLLKIRGVQKVSVY
ncbi:MAG: amino acid-binding ACT domain protein [Candidatus Bathyarchaeia archaeon]